MANDNTIQIKTTGKYTLRLTDVEAGRFFGWDDAFDHPFATVYVDTLPDTSQGDLLVDTAESGGAVYKGLILATIPGCESPNTYQLQVEYQL